ncbi:hypothetical protein HGA91_04425 [candidate division WWE3 bacterium]|nr:hypothetical protein [candidate division WWE3 bacterium]
MDISLIKRQKALLTAVVFGLGLLYLRNIPLLYLYQIILLVSVILLLSIWFLQFDLKWTEYFRLLTPIGLYTVISYVRFLPLTGVIQWVALGAFVVGLYILILAINIMNVSTVRTVPLRRAALSTLFFIGIALFFIFGLQTINAGWGMNVNLFLYWVLLSLFGLSYLSLSNNRMSWIEGLLFSFISLKFEIMINFWPASWIIAAGALVGWNFIMLGIFQHHIERNLKSSILREYLVIGLLLLAAFIGL